MYYPKTEGRGGSEKMIKLWSGQKGNTSSIIGRTVRIGYLTFGQNLVVTSPAPTLKCFRLFLAKLYLIHLKFCIPLIFVQRWGRKIDQFWGFHKCFTYAIFKCVLVDLVGYFTALYCIALV